MYRNSNQDLISAGLISALGAGIVTSFAVNQGQHPLTALLITALAGVCGMICHQWDLI